MKPKYNLLIKLNTFENLMVRLGDGLRLILLAYKKIANDNDNMIINEDLLYNILTDYSTFTGKDGAVYGKLDMNRYMAQFIMDRFIDFEIEQPQAKGLKIPVSAVTEKNFYMLPKS